MAIATGNAVKFIYVAGNSLPATVNDSTIYFLAGSKELYVGRVPIADYSGEIPTAVSDLTNDLGFTSNKGTVTSVRVRATSPVKSSVSTAQSASLNTTISLANGYGDTKNPYGNKTANYVLAGPASGSASAPSFRQLTSADIPSITKSKISDFPAIPSKTSELTNDSGFITTADIPEGATASTTTPLMDGTADTGSELAFARGDHVHPSDTSRVPTTRKVNGKALSSDVTIYAGDVKLSSSDTTTVSTSLGNKVDKSSVGQANGVVPLNSSSKIDSTYLPSYVDDVIEGYYYNSKFYTTSAHTTEISGETGKIFVDLSTNKTYRYSGSAFVEISQGSIVSVSRDLTSGTKIGTITVNGTGSDLYAPTPPVTSVNGATGAVTVSVPTKVSDLTNDSGFTSNTGTVTSVRVQATSPVQSSTSTAQSSTLNTTISLADGYGDTKNPYSSKTKNYVLAASATANSAPSFRALVESDIPSLSVSKISDFPTIPSKTSDLTNDSGFITTSDIPEGAAASTTTPKMDGTASTGTELAFARGDHVHPTDTSRAAATHSHGNITSGGDITSTVAIASGDRLVINDESASKINNSSITFGNSTTTFLANNGTWQTPASAVTSVNTKTGAVVLSAEDVGALPSSTAIPTKTSDLTNDSGFLTSHQVIKQDGITGSTITRYGECSIAASTAAKTVAITSGTFSLEAGSEVTVRFTNSNTANNPTLNVSGTGAKNVFHKGVRITTGANKALLSGVCKFIYDGTQYHLIGGDYATYGTTSVGSASAGTAISADDITSWTTNTPTVVTKKTVVTGGSTTNITPVTGKTVVTSASGATATYASGKLTLTNGSFGTGSSVTSGTAVAAYTSLTTGDSVEVTAGTAASLSYTSRSIPNISVSSVDVVKSVTNS